MTDLSISMFGPLQVRIDGQPLPPLRSRKGYWLLALLVLNAGRPVRREWLAEEIWPESMLEEGLGSLRQSLSDLKKAQGTASNRLSTPGPGTLHLDPAGANIDVIAFDAALSSGDDQSLDTAAELFRAPLLQDWTEGWVAAERESRREAFQSAIETRVERLLAKGARAAASQWLRRGAELDPLRQTLHRRLMTLLADSGQVDGSLQVYRELVERLHREFGLSPEPETAALAHRLRTRHRRTLSPPVPLKIPVAGEDHTFLYRGPLPAAPLLGRNAEVERVRYQLIEGRLVTLVGPGGVGKTRIALEVARDTPSDYVHGAWFVDLAPLRSPELVPRELAETLGIQERTEEGIVAYLRDRQLLLVLDNCEHLTSPIRQLAGAVLSTCSGIRVLATSRERLRSPWEHVIRIPPLPRPAAGSPMEALAENPAVCLFRARSQAAGNEIQPSAESLEAVASICRQLDGLPLAIELAAPLLDVLTPRELGERLHDRLRLLVGGGSSRQGTLRATIDWSYDLLTAPEQALLRRLSVFNGGWDLDAACAIGGDHADILTLSSLVAKSLVVAEETSGAKRYRMLDTIRLYASEKFGESGEKDEFRQLHRHYYLTQAAKADLTGPGALASLARLTAEQDNFRAALECTASIDSTSAHVQEGIRLAVALGRFWQIRGDFAEGRRWLESWLSFWPTPDDTRAEALSWCGMLAIFEGDYKAGQARIEEGLSIGRQLASNRILSGGYGALGIIAKDQGRWADATSLFQQSLDFARKDQDSIGEAGALGYMGIVAASQESWSEAQELYERSLAIRREYGDQWGIAASLNNLGLLARARGELCPAEELLLHSLAIRRSFGDRRSMAISLNHVGAIALARGDCEAARRSLQESLELAKEIGDRRSVAYSIESFARLAAAENQVESAVQLLSSAQALRHAIGAPLPPSEQAILERDKARFQAALGSGRFEAIWNDGASTPQDNAILRSLLMVGTANIDSGPITMPGPG